MSNEFCFDDNTITPLANFPPEFAPLFTAMSSIVDQFQSDVDWDISSFASLLVLQFLAVGQDEDLSVFSNQATVDRLRSTIVNALKDHCCSSTNQQSSKLANIVRQVDKFLPFRNLGLNCLQKAINSGCILPQLLAEIYHEGLRLSTSLPGSSLAVFGLTEMGSDLLHHQQSQQQAGSSQNTGPISRNIKVEAFQVPY